MEILIARYDFGQTPSSPMADSRRCHIDDSHELRHAGGASLSETWVPKRFHLSDPHPDKSKWYVPDVYAAAGVPVITAEALETPFALELKKYGEWLPLVNPEADFLIYNCTTVFDPIDWDRSEVSWLEEGKRVMGWREVSLKEDLESVPSAFRLFRNLTVTCTSAVARDAYLRSGLSGLGFVPIQQHFTYLIRLVNNQLEEWEKR